MRCWTGWFVVALVMASFGFLLEGCAKDGKEDELDPSLSPGLSGTSDGTSGSPAGNSGQPGALPGAPQAVGQVSGAASGLGGSGPQGGLCQGVSCSDHGRCAVLSTPTSWAAVCQCEAGFRADGQTCVTDPCYKLVACSGHGQCAVQAGSPICQCDAGYRADRLTCVTDPCWNVGCSGHGQCALQPSGSLSCQCDAGYRPDGLSCAADPCWNVGCSGHGQCAVNLGNAICQCDDGYRAQGQSCLVDPFQEANLICIEEINRFRAKVGEAPLARWSEAESCASEQSLKDHLSRIAHGAFGSCGEAGQNECPGWGGGWRGDPRTVIRECLQAMWDEGPGGGHYENIKYHSWKKVACGFYQDGSGWVTAVQDFR